MSKKLAWIYFFLEHKDAIKSFSPEALKEGLLAVLDYVETGEKPDKLSALGEAAYYLLKSGADRALEHHTTNREKGIKGMESRWHKDDKPKKEPKEESKTKEPIPKAQKGFVLTAPIKTQIIAAWKEVGIGGVSTIEGQRAQMVRARIEQHSLEAMFKAINNVKKSAFLQGSSWFSFDWMIRPNNFVKVLDGNYSRTSEDLINDTSNYGHGDEELWENL